MARGYTIGFSESIKKYSRGILKRGLSISNHPVGRLADIKPYRYL
jgi:hypothetical protein